MLAAFETVPGTKSMLFTRSALPVAPIHVPFLSFTKSEIPGKPLILYFSNNPLNEAFLGCRLLLSLLGGATPMLLVETIWAFWQAKSEQRDSINKNCFIAQDLTGTLFFLKGTFTPIISILDGKMGT